MQQRELGQAAAPPHLTSHPTTCSPDPAYSPGSRRVVAQPRSGVASVTQKVTALWRFANRGVQLVTHPRSWRLWLWSPAAIAWLLVDELLVVTWLSIAIATSTVTGADLTLLSVLLVCAMAHVSITTTDEERRRAAHGDSTHIDMTCLWVLPSAVLLPAPLAVVVVIAMRLQRHRIARKPLFKWLHTTAAMTCSVLSVHLVFSISPLPRWLHTGLPTSGPPMLAAAGWLGAVLLAYYVAQTVLVSGVRALACRFPRDGIRPIAANESTFVYAVGTWWDNWLFMFALLIAFVDTLALSVASGLAFLLLPVGVFIQLLVQRWEESRTDTRTGALTDVGVTMPARRVLERHMIAGEPVSLAMIDIDHFKKFNDTHGHLSGNHALAAVARAIGEEVRQGVDLVGRWGGEEFIVLMPGSDLAAARTAAERIRAAVQNTRILTTNRATGDPMILGDRDCAGEGCTVSIGVAAAPAHGTTIEELTHAADDALYKAKNTGRNRVHAAGNAIVAPERLAPFR